MIRTSTFALPPRLVAVAWLALAVPPAFAPDDAADVADAHILQAERALQRDEYKPASTEDREAAEASADAEVARQATQVSYTYGFHDDALESARRWFELDPASDEALLYLAQLQLRNGERRSARKSFRE